MKRFDLGLWTPAFCAALTGLLACGGSPAPARAPGESTTHAAAATAHSGSSATSSSTGSSGKSSPGSTSGPAAAVVPPKRDKIAMYNDCPKPMRLYFKRPGADLQTSITNGSRTEERASDGDVIQLMDETGRNEIDHITITSAMNQVDVSKDCKKLEGK